MIAILTWLFELGSETVVTKLANSLQPNPLIVALSDEVGRWAADDPAAASEGTSPDALIGDLFSMSVRESPARDLLRMKLEQKSAPGVELWFEALYERWEHIRNEARGDARPFFRLPPGDAEASLRNLAKRLEAACLRSDAQIALSAILDQVSQLASLIEEERAGRYSLADARSAFLDYSKPLLRWPSRLKTGDHIPRPEYDKILRLVEGEQPSVTVLLGERGAGKSALLANVASAVVQNGWTLFAIKADLLNESSDEELGKALALHASLPRVLAESAKQSKTVLIIDQLDAVAEIADRSGRRLNFLLNLIQRVGGTANLHVVISSRPFEFRTDARLASVRAEPVELTLPRWEEIAPVLTKAGHRPESFLEPLQELLRNPWSLNMYLEVATPDQQFGSMTELLEAVWLADVTSAVDGSRRATLLDEVVAEMTEVEQLSVPSSLTDRESEAANGLVASGILIRDGHRLLFRHQTFYEFILARRFARDDGAFMTHVRQRQDGLFVRPTVLATLTYMRDASRARYSRTMTTLLTDPCVRLHIRSLAVDLLASQREPDGAEAGHIVPRLSHPVYGSRILLAAAGSPGWFTLLSEEPAFREILADRARAPHALALLMTAVHNHRDDVLDLVNECWGGDATFDNLTTAILAADNRFTGIALTLATTVVGRTEQEWLIEQAAAVDAAAAIQMLRADLSRRIPADVFDRAVTTGDHDAQREIRHLIENDARDELFGDLAGKNPAEFVQQLWPWFANMGRALAEELTGSITYRTIWYFDLDDDFIDSPALVDAFVSASREFARTAPLEFIAFVRENSDTDVLLLHLVLASGVAVIAKTDAHSAIDYILSDPRRLALGFRGDRHELTAQIITSAYPNLDPERRKQLETAVAAFEMYPAHDDGDEERQQKRTAWNCEHRLQLLEAIPADVVPHEITIARDELRREFPDTGKRHRHKITGGTVGPPITAIELRDMQDEEWLRLFDEVDDTHEKTFDVLGVDIARSGGVYEQANAVRDTIIEQPDRSDVLLASLQPARHQRYAAAILQGIGTTRETADLANLVRDLDARGFDSDEFRALAANVLGDAAKRGKGLNDQTITMLRQWLAQYPPSDTSFSQRGGSPERPHPVVVNRVGHGLSFGIPHRSQIAIAIGDGLLSRREPAVATWIDVFRGEIPLDDTETFWLRMLQHFALPLNERTDAANDAITSLFDAHPHLLSNQAILWTLGQFMPRLDVARISPHLERLRDSGDDVERQIFGELIMLAYAWHEDGWSRRELQNAIDRRESAMLTGIAFVAPMGWNVPRLRATYCSVLKLIASAAPAMPTAAVADFLRDSVDEPLDRETEDVIRSVLANDSATREHTAVLVEIAEQNAVRKSQLAHDIAVRVLGILGPEINAPGRTMQTAAALTAIALTLHRQGGDFRHAGLELFERLIELNVREADAALELLDRRPTRRPGYSPVRRRYRKGTRPRRRRR